MSSPTYSRPSKPLDQWCTRRNRLNDHVEYAEFCPGDRTLYAVLVTAIDDAGVCKALGCVCPAQLITLTNFDCKSILVHPGHFLYYGYVEGVLGIPTSSAVTMCEIVRHLTGIPGTTWDEFEQSNRQDD